MRTVLERARSPRWLVFAVAASLLAFLILAYRQALHFAFVNDDYLFLGKIQSRTFFDLWGNDQLFFGWYRPISRELHYWVLYAIAGPNEWTFHAAGFALWTASMVAFFLLVRRWLEPAGAAIATLGVASLALWGTPIAWAAGAQDLWMVLFVLLALHAVDRGRDRIALPLFALALLSKETAVVVPGIATAQLAFVRGLSPGLALRRASGLWAIAIMWFLLHPTLRGRLFSHATSGEAETEDRPGFLGTLAKTLLAQLNLEDRLAPLPNWSSILVPAAIAAALFIPVLWLAFEVRRAPVGLAARPIDRRRVAAFGGIWALLGWSILFMPSIGWHAYYGVLGSFGIWIAIGAALTRAPVVAIPLIAALLVLREARAATPSWDWGTFWYQERAGSVLSATRDQMMRVHPTLPPGSRLYFKLVPNNIGLLAGDGPAFRIWYDDPTLEAHFLSAYRPRMPADSLGRDYFFRYDSERELVEIHTGPERFPEATRHNPRWKRDHDVLASTMMRAGEIRGAAEEYAKLWQVYGYQKEYALYAGAAFEAAGDTASSASLYREAARAYEVDPEDIRGKARRFVQQARAFRRAAVAAAGSSGR